MTQKSKKISKDNKQEEVNVLAESLWGLSFVLNFGFMILVPTLIGLWLGLTLDNKFDTKPWLTVALLVIGTTLGFLGGIYQVKRYIKNIQEREESIKKLKQGKVNNKK